MRWRVHDIGSYDHALVVECEPRPGRRLAHIICAVYSPAEAFVEPTDADRAEMLATAEGIVGRHNAGEGQL